MPVKARLRGQRNDTGAGSGQCGEGRLQRTRAETPEEDRASSNIREHHSAARSEIEHSRSQSTWNALKRSGPGLGKFVNRSQNRLAPTGPEFLLPSECHKPRRVPSQEMDAG